MKTAPVPADLPPLAVGFLAKHAGRPDRLALYRRDGTMSNSYPAGYSVAMIREAYDFGPYDLLDNGHVMLRLAAPADPEDG